jgi:tetratricopeptide (TPR) repeat protein
MDVVMTMLRSSHLVDSFRRLVWLAPGLLLVLLGTAVGVVPDRSFSRFPFRMPASFAAQAPVKSKIEQELDKTDSAKKNVHPAAKKSSGHSRSAARRGQPIEYPVTFVSDMPGAEITIDGNVVGKTKEDRRLTVKLKKGRYKATTSLAGYNSQSMPVAVFGEATYAVNLGKPNPPPTPSPTPLARASATPEAVAPPMPPSADDIIKRFIDPRETSKVTAAEWREVVAQSEGATAGEPTGAQAIARFHLGRGQLAYLNTDYAEAVSEFNRSIVALPLSGIPYYSLGNAYLATNQPLEATKAFQRASALTPEVAALAHKGMGDAFTKLHKPKDANAYYDKARGLGCVSPEINKGMALNLMAEKQWQRALSELEATEGSDSSAERYLYLGECYENLKRPLNAYQSYLKATQIDPDSAFAFSKLGDVLYLQRDFPAAEDAFERALALDTTGKKINREMIRKRANAAALRAKKLSGASGKKGNKK